MEKKVSCSAVEAMERTTDSTERLASLMNRMDTKFDRREGQCRPRVYQGRGQGYRQNDYGSRNRLYSRDWHQNNYREEEIAVIEVVIEIIGPIIEITVGPEIGTVTEMVTGIPIDQITEGKIVVKGMVIETKIMADLEIEIEIEIGRIGIAPEKVPNPEAVPKTDTRIEGRVEMIPEIGTGLNLDLDPLLIQVLIESEAGVIGAMNMTILPDNALMIHQVEIQMMPKALF